MYLCLFFRRQNNKNFCSYVIIVFLKKYYYRLLKSTPCETKSPTITITMPNHFIAGIASP